MKKRIKATGEIVDIIDYHGIESRRANTDYVRFIGSKGDCRTQYLANLYMDFEDVEEEPQMLETGINWEERRFQVAKEAITAIMSNPEFYEQALSEGDEEGKRSIPNSIVAAAVCFADALIDELKKGGKKCQE